MAGNHNSGRRASPLQYKKLRYEVTEADLKAAPVPTPGIITKIDDCLSVIGYEIMNERTQRIYRDLCQNMINMRVLDHIHLYELLVLAREFDLFCECEEALQTEPPFWRKYNKNGKLSGIVHNPSAKQRNVSARMIRAFGAAYGLSPFERKRIIQAAEEQPQRQPMTFQQLLRSGYFDDDEEEDE